MTRFVIVELDNGDQEFFESIYDGLKFARAAEGHKTNSVEYLSIGEWVDGEDGVCYQGQSLRNLIRSLDNLQQWLKSTIAE